MALNNATHQPENQDSILMSSNNMRHKHRLRNLLKTCLTTSTLAFMLSGGNAWGVNLNVTANVNNLQVGNAIGLSAAFNNGDRLIFGVAAPFNITTAGPVTINKIQNQGGLFTINHAVTITKNNLQMNVLVDNGGILNPLRNNMDVTGAVTLGANAGNVTIQDATGVVTVGGGQLTIRNAANGVTVNAGGTVVMNLGNGITAGGLSVDGAGAIFNNAANAINVTGGVTVNNGGVAKIQDALGAYDVSIDGAGSTLTLRNATQDVIMNGGTINQTGTIGRNLVVNGGTFNGNAATNVTGAVTLGANAGNVTIQDATEAVTVGSGILTMRNAANGVTVNAGGEVVMNLGNGITAGGLSVNGAGAIFNNAANAINVTGGVTVNNGGVATIQDAAGAHDVSIDGAGSTLTLRNATQDVTMNGGTINQTGTIGRNLVVNGGTFNGNAATNIAGTVTLGANAGNVTIQDAAGAVTVNGGFLTANDLALTLSVDNTAGNNSTATVNKVVGATTLTAGGEVNLLDGGELEAVDSGTARQGTLTILGAGTVHGIIGGTNALAAVNFASGVVMLEAASTAATFNVGNAVALAASNAVANELIKGNVTFDTTKANIFTVREGVGRVDNAASTIDFGVAGANLQTLVFGEPVAGNRVGFLEFKEQIANGGTGVLSVQTMLSASDASIGTIKTINIGIPVVNGNAAVPKIFRVDASLADVTLLPNAGDTINFMDADSVLQIYSNGVDKIVTFSNDLPGGVTDANGALNGAGGIVALHGNGGNVLTLTTDAGANVTLGTAANQLNTIWVEGNVVNDKGAANKFVDLTNTQELKIANGAEFTDYSNTSAAIASVTIGADLGGGHGRATWTIDARDADFDLLNNGAAINFAHPGATLTLQNTNPAGVLAGNNRTVTLRGNLSGAADEEGIVKLYAAGNNGAGVFNTLTLRRNAAETLGIAGHRLKELIIKGEVDGNNVTVGTEVYAKKITLQGAAGITFNQVIDGGANSLMQFNSVNTTSLNANTAIVTTDFNGQDSIIKVANGVNFTTNLVSNNGGEHGTVRFVGNGELINFGVMVGIGNGIGLIKAGANGAIVKIKGPHRVTELQVLNKGGTIQFYDNAHLIGSINSTGGKAGALVFDGNGIVGGAVGSVANPVGNILINGNNGAIVNLKGNVTIDAANNKGVEFTGNGALLRIQGDLVSEYVDFDNAAGALNIGNLEFYGVNPAAFDGEFRHPAQGVLNVNTDLTVSDLTAAQITTINIGSAAAPKTYSFDVSAAVAGGAAVDILANGATIVFGNEDSTLKLVNNNAGVATVNLAVNLDPGALNKGKVALEAVVGATLRVTGGSLGTAGNSLKDLTFAGAGTLEVISKIYTNEIDLSIAAITLDHITSNVKFTGATTLKSTNIDNPVNFNDQNGTIKILNGGYINAVSGGNPNHGTVIFEGDGQFNGIGTNLRMVQAGIGNVTFAAGGHSIAEIQGTGNKTLTFADGFNNPAGIINGNGSNVKLDFHGGSIGDIHNVDTIDVGGEMQFTSIDSANSVMKLHGAAGTAVFPQNVTLQNIDGDGAGNGKIKLTNNAPIIINSLIGRGQKINTIEIAGGDVTLAKKVNTTSVVFSNAANASTLKVNELDPGTGFSTNGINTHTIELAANYTFSKAVGDAAHGFKTIKLINGVTATIEDNIYSTITGINGKVIFNKAGSSAGALGEVSNLLAAVSVAKDATIRGSVYAKDISVAAGQTATFAGDNSVAEKFTIPTIAVNGRNVPRAQSSVNYDISIYGEKFNLADATSTAKYEKGVLLETPVIGGSHHFAGNAVIVQKDFNANGNVTLPSIAVFNGNFKAGAIAADNTTMIFTPASMELKGNLQAKNTVMDLGVTQVTYTGTADLSEKFTVKTVYDAAAKQGGQLIVGQQLNLANITTMDISVGGMTNLSQVGEGAKISLITGGVTGKPKNVAVSSEDGNRFVYWTVSANEGLMLLSAEDKSKEVLENDVKDERKEIKDAVEWVVNAEVRKDSDAAKFLNDLGFQKGEKEVTQAFNALAARPNIDTALTELSSQVTTSIDAGLSQVTNVVDSRLSGFIAPSNEGVALDAVQPGNKLDKSSGVSSGDDDRQSFGAWGRPFYSQASQKMKREISGYKAKAYGGTLGFDTLLNDNALVGGAYTRIHTALNHKDYKVGDKTKIDTDVFSLYGLYNLKNNWFVQGVASYSSSDINNREARRTSTKMETATGNYTATSYGAQLTKGYNCLVAEKTVVTPVIGMRYAKFKDGRYKEEGTSFQNLSVAKKSYNRLEGILGVRAATNISTGNIVLTPEIHGFVNYSFHGKTPPTDARLDGIVKPLPAKTIKASKASYNIGLGITASHNMLEYGATYDLNLANKYIGHQGSVKLKVNF